MNPSHPKAFQLLHRLQKSLNRKIGVEKNHIEEMEATRVERDNNKLNGLITCRATAGALTAAGHYGLGKPEVLELYEAKFEMKETKIQELKDRKYNTRMKEYKEGIAAMDKARMYDIVLQQIDSAPDEKTRKAILKTAKRDKQLLLSKDYLALILFKQMSMCQSKVTKPPKTIHDREDQWFTRYKKLPNPEEPEMPDNYTAIESEESGGLLEVDDTPTFDAVQALLQMQIAATSDDTADDLPFGTGASQEGGLMMA